jgi:hypothetical protein
MEAWRKDKGACPLAKYLRQGFAILANELRKAPRIRRELQALGHATCLRKALVLVSNREIS